MEETHIVPRESYRRRMAVFFYTNRSGDESLDWLQYGATELLTQDLVQDPFVLANSPWVNWGNGYYARMRAAGFEDGLGIPRSLMREIAADANRQYFTDGTIGREGEEYVITTRLWETRTMNQLAQITLRGWDYFDLFDETSKKIRMALDVPASSHVTGEDLPLAETYGESQNAFRFYIEGLNERLFTNDVEASNARLDKALAEDPNFVKAHYTKAINLLEAGDLPGANAALDQVRQLDYRLPSEDRAVIKAISYRLSGQTDKMVEFLRLQVRLRDDAASYFRLGNMLMFTGELEEAKENFRVALVRDSLNLGINLVLSGLERATGNFESAIEYAQVYQRERPEEMEAHLQLGDLLRDTGNLDQAEEHYAQAQLLESNPVAPTLRLAIIAARRGEEAVAQNLLAEARDLARTAADKGAVEQLDSFLNVRFGRINTAIERLVAAEAFLSLSLPPYGVALATYSPIIRLNLHLGDIEGAERALETGLGHLQAPMDKFLAADEALIWIARGELDRAEQSLVKHREIIQQFKLDALTFQTLLVESFLLASSGDHAAAVEAMHSCLEKIDRSFMAAELYAHYVPGLLAELARLQILAGDIEGARNAVERGFRLDPSQPQLWVSRARLQGISGAPQLALASVNYALAIWEAADPEYDGLIEAKSLAKEIEVAFD